MGALFLHTALLAGLVITCGSPAISLCSLSFVETLFAPDESSSGLLSAVSTPPGVLHSIQRFLVLVSFCGAAADLLFQLWFAASVSGLQFRTLLHHCQPSALSVRLFCFFLGACHHMWLSLLFLYIRFCSLSLQCFKRFHFLFVYLDRSSFIFGIHLLLQFLFSSVFRPAASQRP